MRPRIAVSARTDDLAGWAAHARRVEAMGFDQLQVADHFGPGSPGPFAACAAALVATESIEVGTLVINGDWRHVAVTAQEAATLAELSGGRFELGIGAGHAAAEYAAVGIAQDPGRVRVDRLAEQVAVLGPLLAGEAVTSAGDHVRLDACQVTGPAADRARLLVGGNGKRVLTLAAQHADVVGLTGFYAPPDDDPAGTMRLRHFTAAGLADRIAVARDAAAGAGRTDGPALQVLVQAVVVTDDRRGAAERIGTRFALAPDDVADSPFVLLGTHDQIAEQLRERTDRYGVTTWTVFERHPLSDQHLATMAPVIDALRG